MLSAKSSVPVKSEMKWPVTTQSNTIDRPWDVQYSTVMRCRFRNLKVILSGRGETESEWIATTDHVRMQNVEIKRFKLILCRTKI